MIFVPSEKMLIYMSLLILSKYGPLFIFDVHICLPFFLVLVYCIIPGTICTFRLSILDLDGSWLRGGWSNQIIHRECTHFIEVHPYFLQSGNSKQDFKDSQSAQAAWNFFTHKFLEMYRIENKLTLFKRDMSTAHQCPASGSLWACTSKYFEVTKNLQFSNMTWKFRRQKIGILWGCASKPSA